MAKAPPCGSMESHGSAKGRGKDDARSDGQGSAMGCDRIAI